MLPALEVSAHQQPIKTLEQLRKLLSTIVELLLQKSLIKLAYRLAHPMQFFRMFWHGTCGSKDCSEIAKFWLREPPTSIARKLLNDVNNDPDLLGRVDGTWVYSYDVDIKAWSFLWNRPEKARSKKARQVGSNSVGFCSLLFRSQWRCAPRVLARLYS